MIRTWEAVDVSKVSWRVMCDGCATIYPHTFPAGTDRTAALGRMAEDDWVRVEVGEGQRPKDFCPDCAVKEVIAPGMA